VGLSNSVCNACTLMSQGTGMIKLYYGRPYGVYSTFVLLNSQVDQVNWGGWVGWDGASEYLSTSTYAEYNTQAYTDPAVGTSPYPSILFYPTTGAGGVIPTGGNTGSYGALTIRYSRPRVSHWEPLASLKLLDWNGNTGAARTDPQGISRGIRACGPAILPSAQPEKDAGAAWRRGLQVSRTVHIPA
jgi:hypothetical protein